MRCSKIRPKLFLWPLAATHFLPHPSHINRPSTACTLYEKCENALNVQNSQSNMLQRPRGKCAVNAEEGDIGDRQSLIEYGFSYFPAFCSADFVVTTFWFRIATNDDEFILCVCKNKVMAVDHRSSSTVCARLSGFAR
jgi:hypothetical protein